ncbi:MAG: hypothetical protein WA632_08930 [Gallionella sp.]
MPPSPAPTLPYTIGGSVSGLTGTLKLRNNGTDELTLTANGGFTFATAQANNSAYSVTIASMPPAQSCNVTNASGTIAGANVSNLAVTCTTTPPPPPPGTSGSLDPGFGTGGKVTTDFSGAPPVTTMSAQSAAVQRRRAR